MSLLVRTAEEAQHISQHGLSVSSKDGDFVVHPAAVSHVPSELPRADVAIVTLKTTANTILLDILPACCRPDGVVMLIQNGLDIERIAAQACRARTYWVRWPLSARTSWGPDGSPTLITARFGLVGGCQGGTAGGIDAMVQEEADRLTAAGVAARAEADLVSARWHKLVWNIPFNGLATVLDQDTQQLLAHPSGRSAVTALMADVVAGAQACGREIASSFVDKMMTDTERMVPYQPSMQLDLAAGRALETQAIYRNPIAAAAAHGVAMPHVSQLADLLDLRSR